MRLPSPAKYSRLPARSLGDRNAFAGKPIEIGIDAVARVSLRRLADVHAFPPASTETIIIDFAGLSAPVRSKISSDSLSSWPDLFRPPTSVLRHGTTRGCPRQARA